jgi:hypothetical protein
LLLSRHNIDSIDLQDRDGPSAKDHRGHSTITNGSLAPHQAETLREVAQETADENLRSPRVSWQNGDGVGDLQQYAEDLAVGVNNSLSDGSTNGASGQGGRKMQQQDALAVAQNGGISGHASDDGDLDGDADDGMDDDMMDKISSSPSIEDGGSPPVATPPKSWPQRVDSLPSSPGRRSSVSPSSTLSGVRPTSPYLEPCRQFPSCSPQQKTKVSAAVDRHHHHLVRGECRGEYSDHDDTTMTTTTNDSPLDDRADEGGLEAHSGLDGALDDDGPVIVQRKSFDELITERRQKFLDEHPNMGKDQEDEAVGLLDGDDNSLLVPYENTDDDDDDDEPFPSVDPRFIDSGWGGECLHDDAEDIDFEFVYALHTFVATVEGQANATKGDTMVLLDDSNSYWWLVRVVKDSSIGNCTLPFAVLVKFLFFFIFANCWAGYLPAEHIETPTERLARLNKHRNIDVRLALGWPWRLF